MTGCGRCTELELRLGDPQLRDADGATRYALVSHLIEAHGATAGPVPGCENCVRWKDTGGIAPDLAARWSLHHYVSHLIPTGRTHMAEDPPDGPIDPTSDEYAAELAMAREESGARVAALLDKLITESE